MAIRLAVSFSHPEKLREEKPFENKQDLKRIA
jgi:hypothetical protein